MNLIWGREGIGDTSGMQMGGPIATDKLGDIYVTGSYNGAYSKFGNTTLVNTAAPYSDINLVKYDSLGNVIWAKTYGSTLNENVSAMCLDSAGNIFIAGYFDSPLLIFGSDTLKNPGCFVAKFDLNGNAIWALGEKVAGGFNYFSDIDVDNNSNVYITGYVLISMVLDTITIANPTNGHCSFVIKIDKNGNSQWGREIGNPNSYGVEGYGICTDKFNNIYTCGAFGDTSLTIDSYTVYNVGLNVATYVAKYDTYGNVLRVSEQEASSGDCEATTVICDKNGNLFLAGIFTGNSVTFGSQTLINSMGGPYNTLFLAKYDSGGIAQWARGTNKQTYAQSLSVDKNNSVFLSGDLHATNVLFGVFNLTVPFVSPDPMFVVKYDSSGNVGYAYLFPSGQYNNRVATDNYGNAYIASDFHTATPLIIANDSLIPSCHRNFFLLRISENLATGVEIAKVNEGNVFVFPNPTNNSISIASDREISAIAVFNSLGEIIFQSRGNTNQERIDLSNFLSGVYYLKTESKGEPPQFLKIIKE